MRFLLLCLLPLSSLLAADRVPAAEFNRTAWAALPQEEPQGFRETLVQDFNRSFRDPAAKPQSGEIEIAGHGWSVVYAASSGPVLKHAVIDFQKHLNTAMQVEISPTERSSLQNWKREQRAIIVGLRDQMPGCGAALSGKKDYQLIASSENIGVCGYDERGALYGLYNLEARMQLRGAPFLPRSLNTVRHSVYGARMTLSGLGWMDWPDWYLRMLPRYGFDAIYASVYANPNGAPAPEPYGSMMRLQDPAKMHDLIRRAANYGLDVYAPIMYNVRGDPSDEKALRKLVRDNATEFPEIRGYVLLIEGFTYEKWPGWNRSRDDMRNWIRQWARGVSIAADEFHKVNPRIEVLPWDYNIDFRREAVDLKRFVIDQYKPGVIPLITWENGKDFVRDREHGYLKDYAINEVGPSEVAAAQIDQARKRSFKVYAKADTFASWQYGTFPYLPFPYQWYERYQGLEKAKIDGVMETWSYGFKPNFMAAVRARYSWTDAPPLEDLLRQVACAEFGAGSEAQVLAAWKHFSDAIRLVPDTGPNMGTTNSIGSPFFFNKPEPRSMTVEHSWTVPGIHGGGVPASYYWPFAPSRVILNPDFSNRTNAAEQYARPFTLPVFTKYLLLAAGEMEKGLETYRAAALAAPAANRRTAYREVLLAGQIERMMRSDAAILEFEDLRFRFHHTAEQQPKQEMLDRMAAIVRDEIARTEAAYETALRDSRLGYEWEQDYFYTPHVLQVKLAQLREVLDRELPRARHAGS